MNMILISRKKICKTFGIFAVVLLNFYFVHAAFAEESLTLSISPSLFDMSANPGQEWQSSLRVINVNKFDLTVYVDVVNFSPQGEGGDGKFIPISASEGDGSTIAEWFTISKESIVIPQEQSVEIPIAVKVPNNAGPGGHFAAILVGTKPISPEAGQARVQTSQMVTSLFFARVAGDINESGMIREFRTTDAYLNSPEATFELRFENKGNVHLKPQGDIKISNMWGQERGVVPINQNSHFGNVLPESIRKFTFTWKGEWSISDIGRYTAVATLAYGADGRQFSSSKTSFWVIPYKLLLGIFIALGIFVALVTWLVKLYVRNMLVMAGIDINEYKNKSTANVLSSRRKEKPKVKFYSPMLARYIDLKQRLLVSSSPVNRLKVIGQFILQYKLLFIAIFFIFIFLSLFIWYIANANTLHRGYEVVYVNSDTNVTLTSEEIIYNQLMTERNLEKKEINPSLPKIKIVNRSGKPGAGAEARLRLESLGYEVTSLEADFSSPQVRTVVVYAVINEKDALRLSSRLNNALVSVYDGKTEEIDVVTVYVGDDIKSN